ncbi:putative phage tail protein [Paenibacillus sp. M1]|uniref:Phage tail protein n=1 Tax=Paenibacillus haidiansis TaxID=1574488 RepID=A0ABU7VMC5_9BACL
MNKLLDYLPEFYHDVTEFVALTEIEASEFLTVQEAMDKLLDDQFVMTASEQAIKRREKMLGIQADPKTESLDFRRKRLVNRYSTKPPFTVRYLQQRLDFLVGSGMTLVGIDLAEYVLTVTANIDNADVFKEVERTVSVIKPANLIYRQKTSLADVIGLEETIAARPITWNYKLDGSWKLGEQAFTELGPEVAVR